MPDGAREDAIGQDSPDKYGEKGRGDMRFLAPAGDAGDLSGLSNSQLEARFDLAPGSLDGAKVEVKTIPDSRSMRMGTSPHGLQGPSDHRVVVEVSRWG